MHPLAALSSLPAPAEDDLGAGGAAMQLALQTHPLPHFPAILTAALTLSGAFSFPLKMARKIPSLMRVHHKISKRPEHKFGSSPHGDEVRGDESK